MIDGNSIVQGIAGNRQQALPSVVGNIDEDPDKAQRSLDLAKLTGVPSTSIYNTLDEFELQHKAMMASDIVANNPHLSDFVQSDPMVPKIANDDYGNLDSVSQKVSALGLPKGVNDWLQSDSIARGAIRGFGDAPIGGMFIEPSPEHRFLASIAAAGLTVPELALRGVNAAIYGLSYGLLGEEQGEKAAQVATDPGLQAALQGLGPPGVLAGGIEGLLSKIRPAALFVKNNREIPHTILPEYDDFRTKQNAEDLDALKEATSESQRSLTRERSPEMFRQFIAQHTDAEIGIGGDAVAALYGDKVPAADDGLLGWVPGIEDKLALARATGDDVSIPLADWLTHAEPEVMQALHDDIRVRPGGITANEAKLGKEMDATVPPPVPLPEEVPTVRAASALEPMFSVGDRKLQLERMTKAKTGMDVAASEGVDWNALNPTEQQSYNNTAHDTNINNRFGPAQGFHDFSMNDEKGTPVGSLNISEQQGGKQLYVDMVNGINGLGPRDFGPALMRDLLRQLKQEFPNAETITGHRVSGMREKMGTWESKAAIPVVKLDRADAHEDFRQLLEGGQWETYSPNIQAYIKPDAARSEQANALVNIVNDELDRIVPKKVAIQGADTIKVDTAGMEGQRAGEDIKVGGTYIRYRDTYPIILYALDGENALSAARHEAIHHLRAYGFFNTEEWNTLEAEALAGGWLKKYRIDSRYPTAKPDLKLEEAVAEAYQDWAGQKDSLADRAKQLMGIESPLDTIFRKMQEFFDRIKERVGALLGKDPQWEDIFQKVSTGEVGGREGTEPLDARAFNEKLAADRQAPDTPEFKNWFGQSKVVDKAGKPLEVFHGSTSKGVNTFDTSRVTDRTPRGDTAGTYFTSDPRNASGYTRRKDSPDRGDITSAYLSLQNPLDTTDLIKKYQKQGMTFGDAKREALKSLTPEHDGIIFRGNNINPPEYVAFKPEQIKSSTRNVGTYDPANPDIRLSVEQPPEGGSRVFERANALGMTVDQYKRYDELIQKRHQEDIDAATRRAMDEKAREQTKQWKADRKDLRQEVSESIKQRPDVAADLFFGAQELYGRKLSHPVKLLSSELIDAQKAALPRKYYGEDGIHPDAAASMFGYGSGDAMVEKLIQYNGAKQLANMSAKDFVSRVTDIETDRQMRIKYGVLEDNIMDAVKEQVAGTTQLDILHEETHALGMKVGQAPLDKATVLSELRDQFSKMPLGSVKSDAYMRAAGKAGRAAEMGLLANDPAAAFRAKQQQYYATVIAREAMQLEKELDRFDKLAKRFSKREVAAVDQEYTNFMHDILMRVGKPVRRSVQDLETEIAAGEYHSLQEFVEGKQGFYLREVAVDDRLFDPNFRKKFEDLTVDEFNGVNTSLKSLLKNGRDEKKITKAGIEEDLAVVKNQMIDQLKQFQERQYDAKGGRWMGPIPPRMAKVLRSYGVAHIQMENLFNRWDHDDPKGVFQQYVMRDLVDASNNESVMEKRYAEKLRGLDDKADLKKLVDNTLFKVPGTDQLMQLNRGNLRTILLNAGNSSNLVKMAKGYKLEPQVMMAWLHQHATKEDWDWAQKMGDVFQELKGEADVMYRNISGVAPENIPLKPIDTPHGQYPGWYYPVIWHPEFEGPSRKLMGKNALEQEGFVRATTANGYTQKRTGYTAPMALDIDMLPARMKQMVHDIAMRPSVINASKIFYDKDVRGAISKHFGNEWRDMLVPYLVDVANSANYIPKDQRMFYNASEFIRQNLISTLVGLNPGTVLKHGPTAFAQSLHEVGPINFLKATKSLFSINERTGESNWQFAMRESEELQRRHQNYVETLGGATEMVMPQGQFNTLRSTIQRFSAMPVAISDLLSAVPTWLAQYEKSIQENGGIHGDAVYDANRAVRRAHGSVAITNRSTVMRGGALGQWFASVYGFFNHIMNRQYEMLWKAGEMVGDAKAGNYREAMQRAPELTSMLFAYVLAPALIEEMVTPLMSSDNESWGKKAAKGLAFTLGASWVGVRDIASAMLNGRDPSVGLISTAGKTITDVARDLSKSGPFNKEHAGKIIKDGSTLLGGLTGLVPAQTGRVAQFGYGVTQGTERPKGPWGWLTGARYGTLKGHPTTFNEWQKHHIGGR